MEKVTALICKLKFHSKIHLAICVLSLILCIILIGIKFLHKPLLITLVITSIITLISGVLGIKLNSPPVKKQIVAYFILQVLVLSAWDFGGVICVLTLVLGSLHEEFSILLVIIISSCVVYVGVFVYFWISFLVVNKLLITFNNLSKRTNKSFGINRTYTQEEDGMSRGEKVKLNKICEIAKQTNDDTIFHDFSK